MEKILHQASRIALRSPYRNNNPNYLDFQTRISRLNALTFAGRRTITSVIYLIKISRGHIDTQFTEIVNQCIRTNTQTRTPHIFNIPSNLFPPNFPLGIDMNNINQLRNIFNFNDAVPTIKSKLKEHFKSSTYRQ